MGESNYRFGVGLLVVGASIIGVLLLLFFGTMPSFLSDRYQVTINFPAAPKVGRDTPVRKNGVQIGRVSNVRLLEGDQGVNLTLELDRNVRLVQGETCRIASSSLITGDAIVEFTQPTESQWLARFDGVGGGEKNGIIDPVEEEFANSVMSDGDYLIGGIVAGDPLEVLVNMQGNFVSTLSAIEEASQRVSSLAQSVESVIGGEPEPTSSSAIDDSSSRDNSSNLRADGLTAVNQDADDVGPIVVVPRTVSPNLRDTLENFNETVETIDRVARQFENSQLPELIGVAAGRLPILFDEAERVLTQTQATLNEFERFGGTLEEIATDFEGIGVDAREVVENANRAVLSFNAFAEPLQGQSQVLIESTVETLGTLDATLRDLRTFAARLNDGDGTIARLIEDDELYYSLAQSLENLELVTNQLQPIVNDVRVFSDKVARDPRQLGVRGALHGGPIGTGLKR